MARFRTRHLVPAALTGRGRQRRPHHTAEWLCRSPLTAQCPVCAGAETDSRPPRCPPRPGTGPTAARTGRFSTTGGGGPRRRGRVPLG